ncbi:MAG: AAA family ATPase [Burkholderiales bacterium]
MKLARLLLQAFGPFTDKTLDFAASGSNLHLIYGPNEAGKSAALRAITDLRFGIPLRSPDDFIHPTGRMRIAGLFIDDQGEPIGLVRRKGRAPTLSRFDIATEQPDPALPVLREHELALTGGVERSEFEAMFGLNHERLRAGGDRLLKGEGELGSALFEASAGTRGIAAILTALDDDAKTIFNPHGRAQNATINEARRQLEEQRSAWRQAQTKPADWQVLNRAHEQAKAKLAEIDQAIEILRRRENELTELRTVEPLLRQHDRALADLQALAEVPDLPESAREERLAAEQALRRAQQELLDADLELNRCAKALAILVIETPLLEHAEMIERLAAGVEAATRSRIEAQQQQAVIERIAADLAAGAARIAPGRDIPEVLNAAPSEADRVALNDHLQAIGRLNERLAGNRQRALDLDEALSADAQEIPALPDPAVRQSVAEALRGAQALGDVGRRRGDLDRQIGELESRLIQALSDMGAQSEQVLRRAQPLLEAQIAQARQELAEVDEATRDARDEDRRLEPQLEEQRLRQRQLAAEGEVVTAETLRLARERRDDGWTRVRKGYVDRTDDAAELGRGIDAAFDADRLLPDAFEAAQEEADRQADLLRADAKRAAASEECSTRIEQMETRRREIAVVLASLGAKRENVLAGWTGRLTQAQLPALDADALREWQGRRGVVLDLADRLAGLRSDREAVLAEASTAASALALTLRAAGQTVAEVVGGGEVNVLPSLIAKALRWEKKAAESEAQGGARADTLRKQQDERKKVGALISRTETELKGHEEALDAWHARLFLPSGSGAETVKARLEELDALARQSTALNDARQAQGHHNAVVSDIETRAAQLALLAGEPEPTSVDDFADRLRRRLAASRESEQERNTLIRDQGRAQQKKLQAETELEQQGAMLARLCSAAGVATADLLPEQEEGAARKRQAQMHLSTLREQLAQASARPEEALRQSLAGQDAVAIESERDSRRLEIGQRETEQAAARQAEEQTRRALESVDTSDRAAAAREAMESAAARLRASIRPWARLKLAHALLKESLNRFRERAQAPMVAAASTYFSLMTAGRYQRLVADEADDKPVLRAERADGVRIGVEAMSDGTADQLYLALRLAALDLRRASHPHMPLVLDDVLITSDDERAANILRALARFAEGGQVMIFTHHRHLIDVARAALGEQALVVHSL